MGGEYGGFGGGGYGDRAKEAKERAYSYSQVERLEVGRDAEQYESPEENSFQSPAVEPESTVSIDVDTASYANAALAAKQPGSAARRRANRGNGQLLLV